jgi:hypothetical protein
MLSGGGIHSIKLIGALALDSVAEAEKRRARDRSH